MTREARSGRPGFLIEMKEREEIRGGGNPNSHVAILAEIGVEKDESSRWQVVASLPDPAYEGYKAEVKERRG